jgi:predicted metallopeptidase
MGIQEGLRPRWVLERRWAIASLPRRLILGEDSTSPFDLTHHLRRVCEDAVARCPDLGHIDPSAMLVTAIPARKRSVYGLQARTTPMRFRDGATHRRMRGAVYQVQRYFVEGREVLYLVSFCVPRFLDLSFDEKLITVFHELYHIGPRFDGDLRRHGGRYDVHTRSKKHYDARMAALVKRYLANHSEPALFDFLRHTAKSLRRTHGGVYGVVVPRPKMLPVTD